MTIEIPRRIGYAGGNLKGLATVLQEMADVIESPSLVIEGVTASAAELNVLDGIAPTLTAAELSILDGVTATAAQLNALVATPATFAVVSKTGNDTTGNGSWAAPYLTVTKAVSVWTATRSTIYVLAGEYEEAATLTWPNVTGLSLIGIGGVSISNGNSAAQVINISPTFTASTLEATIEGINIAADTQIGLKVANANMTKKLNIYLTGVTAEMDTSGDSVDVAGTVSGQAIRCYVKDCDFEGLFHFTVNDSGSRLRVENTSFTGGLTTVGAVASEVSLRNSKILTSGITVAAEQKLTTVGCVYATDADPAVYTNCANAYATYA